MGTERPSTTRMRGAGRICCSCRVFLDPLQAKERYCAKCEPQNRVYMELHARARGWHVAFLEEDLRTSLRRKFTFGDEQKVVDLAKRRGGVRPGGAAGERGWDFYGAA